MRPGRFSLAPPLGRLGESFHRIENPLDFLGADARVDRQLEQAGDHIFGDGTSPSDA
jgi:hypothetical protein